ncbi:MAG: hypothetical protein LBU64_01105 [Planctomycetota bacterium]|nr:hypothetical protein [Planctomycetota bacterium]
MEEILRGESVILGVTGSIAAYKAAVLASGLTQAGALVDVVMTEAAREFVTPLTFSGLTHRKTYTDIWEAERKPGHVALAERPDIVVVAPATANTMAKMAQGLADNLLTSILLATRKPVLLAPAMNSGMWEAPATARNLERLRADGIRLVGPKSGGLACGDRGIGRMAEPAEILAAIGEWLAEIAAARWC